jgi:RNA polymerase sigma factor (sigma-70 family)
VKYTNKKWTRTIVRSDDENKEREALIKRAAKGDNAAFETYHQMNVNLFHSIVNKSKRKWPRVDIESMEQEGMLGLMRGITKYCVTKKKNSRPETYIYQWVDAAVRQYCRVATKIESYTATYSENKESNISTAPLKITSVIDEPSTNKITDFEISNVMEPFFATLHGRDLFIARARFVYDNQRTLEDIGGELGISRERVRQVALKLVTRFGAFAKRHGLELYHEV